jgi:hypothetical protein
MSSIADLPFREESPLALLNVDEFRVAPDPDYEGYGYARVDEIVLAGHGDEQLSVRDALLVVVHTDDDPPALTEDLELAFPDENGREVVAVLLSDFLRVWLPRIRGNEQAIVLVTCNPHRARVWRPEAAGTIPVYYALGDVESWLDHDGSRQTLRLLAEDWRTAEQP